MSGNANAPAKKKSAKKKRTFLSPKAKKILILIIAAVLIAAALVCALFFGVFRVRKFAVKGEIPYTAQQVIDASGIPLGKNLFTADYEGAKERISTELPYTADIKIAKKLPSTVVITASTAKKTYGVMMPGGTYAITDENLKVLEIGAELPPGTMMVEGYSGSGVNALGRELPFGEGTDDAEIKEALTAISQAVKESEISGIDLINVANPESIYILYDGRIIIRLGNTSDILKKLNLAQKSIEEENKLSDSQYGELKVTAPGRASFIPKDYKDMPELVDYTARKLAAEQGEDETEGEDVTAEESEEPADGEEGYDSEPEENYSGEE